MSIFSERYVKALFTGEYICSECGAKMVFDDEWETRLVCPKCWNSMSLEEYSMEEGEQYTELYPIFKTPEIDCDEDE